MAESDRKRERLVGQHKIWPEAFASPCIPAQTALISLPEAGNGQAGPVSGLFAARLIAPSQNSKVSVAVTEADIRALINAICVNAIYRCGGSNRMAKKIDALFSRFTRQHAKTCVEHLA